MTYTTNIVGLKSIAMLVTQVAKVQWRQFWPHEKRAGLRGIGVLEVVVAPTVKWANRSDRRMASRYREWLQWKEAAKMAEIDNDWWWHHIVCFLCLNPKKKNIKSSWFCMFLPINCINRTSFCHWCETHGLIRSDYGSEEICTSWVWVSWLCVLPFQWYARKALALGCQVSGCGDPLRRTAAGWKEPSRKTRKTVWVWPSQKVVRLARIVDCNLNGQVFM